MATEAAREVASGQGGKVNPNESTDTTSHRQKVVLDVNVTMEALLQNEDKDGNCLITIDDSGPKDFTADTVTNGKVRIKGHYPLGNLLQDLFFAKQRGDKHLELLLPDQLDEDPLSRIRRYIQGRWWDNLTRHLDADGIAAAAPDPKTTSSRPRIYVPAESPEQHAYYSQIAAENPALNLDVQWLPEGEVDPEFIKSLNSKPGLLALHLDENEEGKVISAPPFIVPGGRFNELYNWDSVFAAWGALETHTHLVKSIIRHFIFQIKHYGKILNANRSYYLGRSQPPLLTDLALRTYQRTKTDVDSKDLLKDAILAAIKEYSYWWTSEPRLDPETGLSRYRPIGAGLPPECEGTHFDHVLAPYAKKYGISTAEVFTRYNAGDIKEPDLDTFCLHDRAVRESGHDVSNRVQGVCADLATIDLNSLLYKIEKDIAFAIKTHFDDKLEIPEEYATNARPAGTLESSAAWEAAAAKRKDAIDKYLWHEEEGIYFDYNTRTHQPHTYESVTTLWALWSGVASPHQASLLVSKSIPKFERVGGLTVSTEKSRGAVDDAHPQMQWDYPYGWPPHQMLAWEGLKKYGFEEEVERLVYRWLHIMIEVFVNFNGTVVEKLDVTQLERPHEIFAEYGNQGVGFKYAPQEGFGWTNGSFIYGVSLLSEKAKQALGKRLSYEEYKKQ